MGTFNSKYQKDGNFYQKDENCLTIDNIESDHDYHMDIEAQNQSKNCDSIIEEICSLDKLSKIEYFEDFQQEKLFLVKLIGSILSRPYLKQIIVHLWHTSDNYLDTEEEYPKNWSVEEITFDTWAPSFKFLNKVLDALPNIKKLEIFNENDFENLPVFLKNISGLKHLKSLKVAISNDDFDAHKLGHILEIIKNNFPMNSEIVIADMDFWCPNHLTNLIEKKEGEDPKIVYGLSPVSQSWFSRIADLFTRFY